MAVSYRGVGLFEIRTTRSEYSTGRTRVESNPLLEYIELLELDRIVRNDRTVRLTSNCSA